MRMRVIDQVDGERTFALVLDPGQDVVRCLRDFASYQGVSSAHFTAIGGFKDAVLGFFDLDRREYDRIPVDEPSVVLALIGDLARDDDGEPSVHAHAVLGMRDGTTRGGHLLEAIVRPTLEVVVTESAGKLRRRFDPNVGLPLIDLGAS
ncbi:MAG TPA: PPC domain-containing DNA-binding protein [Acidimicrobiia bacterium]|nr:PPC domain-containing DNA-binding protein [Acidimicrobiia bacterium]